MAVLLECSCNCILGATVEASGPLVKKLLNKLVESAGFFTGEQGDSQMLLIA